MDIKKFLVGGIVGGIVFFLLGWLFYGILFSGYLESVSTKQSAEVMRPPDRMFFPGLIVGNLMSGFLFAYVFIKGNVNSLGSGLVTGAILSFLFSTSVDFIIYGTTLMFKLKGIIADVGISILMGCIVGAIVGAVMGKLNK